jgi:FAD/FMN-containing dehydrogenase
MFCGPKSVGDVQAGVRFAASAGLLLSVRGGGHGFPGFGTNDGGVVIDLSKLANVEIIHFSDRLLRRTACELRFHVLYMFATWV